MEPLDLTAPDALSRRRLLGAMGAGAAALAVTGCRPGGGGPRPTTTRPGGGGACVLTPEMTEGPFYQNLDLVRANITEGRPGTPLLLQLTIENPACAPIPGAIVDIWHTDAAGTYSGAKAGLPDTTFMRGSQVADANGLATFETIHPGWYAGRATHIHVKVHVGGRVIHTGQLFFDEALNNAVYATAPYVKPGNRVLNASDGIYRNGGSATIVATTPATLGYLGKQTLVVT